MASREQVIESLKNVTYPGFSKDIVTLGAVENVESSPDAITISLKTISADESRLGLLTEEIRRVVGEIAGGAEVHVALGGKGGEQPHDQKESLYVRKKLPGVKQVVPVTSGKGGVGKSTVAVNLAYTMSQLGRSVGILDLDIFGPSVHKMLGTTDRLAIADGKILPSEAHGLKVISVGMAVDDAEAMVMRGPMVMKLIDQLINHVDWGSLDYLIVDMPPGTGDVPLSLVQQLAIVGAIVVTTPQDVALADVRRAATMFKQTETNILGIVENMSYYVCESCGHIDHIFGDGGGASEADRLGVPLLGSIPLSRAICEQGEQGSPIFNREKNPELARLYEVLASVVIEKLDAAPDPASFPDPFGSSIRMGGG